MSPVLSAQLGAAPVLLSLLYGVSGLIPGYIFYPLYSSCSFVKALNSGLKTHTGESAFRTLHEAEKKVRVNGEWHDLCFMGSRGS